MQCLSSSLILFLTVKKTPLFHFSCFLSVLSVCLSLSLSLSLSPFSLNSYSLCSLLRCSFFVFLCSFDVCLKKRNCTSLYYISFSLSLCFPFLSVCLSLSLVLSILHMSYQQTLFHIYSFHILLDRFFRLYCPDRRDQEKNLSILSVSLNSSFPLSKENISPLLPLKDFGPFLRLHCLDRRD